MAKRVIASVQREGQKVGNLVQGKPLGTTSTLKEAVDLASTQADRTESPHHYGQALALIRWQDNAFEVDALKLTRKLRPAVDANPEQIKGSDSFEWTRSHAPDLVALVSLNEREKYSYSLISATPTLRYPEGTPIDLFKVQQGPLERLKFVLAQVLEDGSLSRVDPGVTELQVSESEAVTLYFEEALRGLDTGRINALEKQVLTILDRVGVPAEVKDSISAAAEHARQRAANAEDVTKAVLTLTDALVSKLPLLADALKAFPNREDWTPESFASELKAQLLPKLNNLQSLEDVETARRVLTEWATTAPAWDPQWFLDARTQALTLVTKELDRIAAAIDVKTMLAGFSYEALNR
jgi:hypothetical protein